jgi:ParB family transcriptional regulator, chromosome partitioning protein
VAGRAAVYPPFRAAGGARFVAVQLLAMPEPLRRSLAAAPGLALFTEVTRQPAASWLEIADTTATARLPLLMLTPIVTAYESALGGGDGCDTWRPDRYSPCPRGNAGTYFAFLASVGYELSVIEQAVADGVPYTGEPPVGLVLDVDSDRSVADGATGPADTSPGASDPDGTPVDADPDDSTGDGSPDNAADRPGPVAGPLNSAEAESTGDHDDPQT